MAFYQMGEIIQYNALDIPSYYIDMYNLSNLERNCEVSVNFYAKSILRGYLKNWLSIAEKRYVLKDYEGAYLLYAYSSFLGLP